MKLQNTSTNKLVKVEKALKILLESGNKSKPEVKKVIGKLATTRKVLKEATLQTVTINQKDPRKEDSVLNVDPASQSTLNTLKGMKNTADVNLGGRRLEEQESRSYSAEESEAVGNALVKFIVSAIRDTRGGISGDPEVTGEKNAVCIDVKYGNNKGEDTFHFELKAPKLEASDTSTNSTETTNPVAGVLVMDINGQKEQVVQFEVTEANEVKFNPKVDIKNRMKELLVKYTKTNIKEPQTDSPKSIDDFIAERKQAIRESFGQPVLQEIGNSFTIKGLGNFEFKGVQDNMVKGSQNNGPVRTFKKDKVLQDNPDFFKPAPRAPRAPKMTEKQYWNLLQGAVDDEGTNRYAHDMAESMILDDSLVRFLKSEYPELRTPEDFVERLQWDLEACEPEGEDAYGNEEEDDVIPEVKSKPDYLDSDKDSNREEPMKKALQDKELAEDFDIGHQDDEPNMLKAELYKLLVATTQLYKMLSTFKGKEEVDFPQWWQAKIIQAADNIKSAKDYLEFETVQPQIYIAAIDLEEVGAPAPAANIAKNLPGDVKALQQAQQSATSVQRKLKNIDSIPEFPGAFSTFMTSLGLPPEDNSRSSIESRIRQELVKLGYK